MSQKGNVLLIVIALLAVVGLIIFIFTRRNVTDTKTRVPLPLNESQSNELVFSNPKKSAHYESNTPSHRSTLAGVPVNVVIDFNFDLAKPSSISIMKDAAEYGVGETKIDANKLVLRRDINPDAPDGLYTVTYKACWPDGSCHDGSFQFAIDSKFSANFNDMTDQNNVTIRMSGNTFEPMNIIINKGTKVTWVNDDSVEHFVNTDSHPAHTYEPKQNSQALSYGDSYSYTFEKPGIYPYHCSAHERVMKASILVR